jgi:hypothetical protein
VVWYFVRRVLIPSAAALRAASALPPVMAAISW